MDSHTGASTSRDCACPRQRSRSGSRSPTRQPKSSSSEQHGNGRRKKSDVRKRTDVGKSGQVLKKFHKKCSCCEHLIGRVIKDAERLTKLIREAESNMKSNEKGGRSKAPWLDECYYADSESDDGDFIDDLIKDLIRDVDRDSRKKKKRDMTVRTKDEAGPSEKSDGGQHKKDGNKKKEKEKKFITFRGPFPPLMGGLFGGCGQEKDEVAELADKIKRAGMPEDTYKTMHKELCRLRCMMPLNSEYDLTLKYLDYVASLPWNRQSKDSVDLRRAKHILDSDHRGLLKPKQRVIEYLAVRKLKHSLKGPILCFVGPPGVGKTSIGRAIADALGRKFQRIALGGCCDQSDIRGHRRTYNGAIPGRIITAINSAGTKNPVILLDEIDKLHTSAQGDPSAALLEVLDPELNHTFVDHYLNVPFDLSQVLFIATANSINSIPLALLDRMELLEMEGYSQEEKVDIAQRHLLPKLLKEHGLTSHNLVMRPDAIRYIVSHYIHESGVRSLERKMAAICRSVAVDVSDAKPRKVAKKNPDISVSSGHGVLSRFRRVAEPYVIDLPDVTDILGAPPYLPDNEVELVNTGVAIGLAWTDTGGTLQIVEASVIPGDGGLDMTGQLGEVMKESASLAVSWVKHFAVEYGLQKMYETMCSSAIHIHLPQGGVSKDGPSAGIAMVVVLISLLTDRMVRSDTAMTGEITLTGVVIPVGGVKEKILAAHRSKIRRVILPEKNNVDLDTLPKHIKSAMKFIFVSDVKDALSHALKGGIDFSRPSKARRSKDTAEIEHKASRSVHFESSTKDGRHSRESCKRPRSSDDES